VVDASPQAKGIIPGMPLPEALSRCPGAVLLEADLPPYQVAFNSLLDSLEEVSPLVEGADLGLAYVGLDGLEELYGGEEPLLAALGRAVAPYEAGTGVGDTKFTAYLASQNSVPARYVVADGPVRQGEADGQGFRHPHPHGVAADGPVRQGRSGGTIPPHPNPGGGQAPALRTPPLHPDIPSESIGASYSTLPPPKAWGIEPGPPACFIKKTPQDVRAFLQGFSVDVLPLPWETIERLRSFGLDTLGEVARLSPGPLQAQLGPQGLLAWELARGIDRRPLQPRRNEEVVTESLTFPAPAVSIEPILLAVEALLARAFRRPQVRGRYVRAVALEARVYRGAAFAQRVAFKEPAGDAQQAYRLIKPRLLNIQLPGPLEDLSATLLGLTGESGRQGSLFSEVRRRDSLRETLRQLEVRLGKRPPVYRVREVEPWSRIPERRRALVEYVP